MEGVYLLFLLVLISYEIAALPTILDVKTVLLRNSERHFYGTGYKSKLGLGMWLLVPIT